MPSTKRSSSRKSNKKALEESPPDTVKMEIDEIEEEEQDKKTPIKRSTTKKSTTKRKGKEEETTPDSSSKKVKRNVIDTECRFVGEPIPGEEAKKLWPHRYPDKIPKAESSSKPSKKNGDDVEETLFAECHYKEALIDDTTYSLGDDAYVKGDKSNTDYIGRIVEFFKTSDGRLFFTAQWFFKAEDTVIKDHAELVDAKRVFISDLTNDNPLDCITSKLNIVKASPNVDLVAKQATIPPCDFYYDMKYSLGYTTFSNILPATDVTSESSSTVTTDADSGNVNSGVKRKLKKGSLSVKAEESKMTLLDLYSGCGAMSTGLCLGAAKSGVDLVTRWAVDFNQYACETLKKNHPETEVRNESAESFLSLIKEWKKLCAQFSLLNTQRVQSMDTSIVDDESIEDNNDIKTSSTEFEVEKLVSICYGDPNNLKKDGLHFKVRWKGYGRSDDTWEPITGLQNCKERIQDFVTRGYHSSILPLPGDVDVICGGPPCQGISGHNRFRNKEEPLNDPKNYQIVVFMDIVDFLKPKYVLMENVVDIVKFSSGFLARYAMGRLVSFDYQARLGMMVAGCYGLPQFRMRVFLWGARPTEKLPPYPLPTHEVVIRGGIPNEFEQNVVAYDVTHTLQLEKSLVLSDAISDLPEVTNFETREEMPYGGPPLTEFQRLIRSSKNELMGIISSKKPSKPMLYDHIPYELNTDDYERVRQVPKRKKANFRDLPGVKVLPDNKVVLDETVERKLLPSGKPLVPNYTLTWKEGYSTEPFGRIWWDETVPTVVTRPQPHNRVITHPMQDRVLSVRENARLQGFPDYYKLCGPIKQRYMQVGNAVAVPVSRALGYVMGLASRGSCTDQPLTTLPPNFSRIGKAED